MLSIVIPTLNSAETIRYCLSSIFSDNSFDEAFEVLIVDGGSEDKTLEIVQEYPVKILTCKEKGIGPARNLGLKKARGRIVCFTDSDCVVESMWLNKIANFFDSNLEVDGVGGLVLWFREGATKLQKLTGKIFAESQNFPKREVKARSQSFVGVLFDANCAYKRHVLLSAGGFPEPVGLGHELSWKLASEGKFLVFNPKLKVFHIFPKTLRRLFKQQFRWGMCISVLKRKYCSENILKEFTYMSYSIAKSFMFLLNFRYLSLGTLRFLQLFCWCLGGLYAMQFQDFHQIPSL